MLINDGSAIVVSDFPIRKCAGVSGVKSAGTVDSGQRGRELRMASICVKTVTKSS